MTKFKCPIWQTPATLVGRIEGGDAQIWDSPRAGGRYAVDRILSAHLSTLNTALRIKITNWVVDQNRLGADHASITMESLNQTLAERSLTVMERRDRLLMYIRKKVSLIGEGIPIGGTATDDYQLAQLELRAWTASEEPLEFYYLIESCTDSELLEKHGNNLVRLTTKGYDYLQNLESETGSGEQAFIAMWFDANMEAAYDDGFFKAVVDMGYRPMRIDRKEHINKIDDEIIAEIRRSRFLVADFTAEPNKPRGGVYFEAGFAYGLNIPVIWTCRADQIDHVHFDTRQFNHIVWSNPEDLCEKLKNRIGAVIGDGPLLNR